MKSRLNQLNKKLQIAQLMLVAARAGCDVQKIFDSLVNAGASNFWVWGLKDNSEIYDNGFRYGLGFNDEKDFPNSPDSWMKQIDKNDKLLAIANFNRHAESFGQTPYDQIVTYHKKDGSKTVLICHGSIVCWDLDKNPLIAVGFHIPYEE